MMSEITHRFINTNGIKMHIAECGTGPLAVLCHGFPELGYTWRHQLPALAEAGFHAVAPDQRGYGQTDRPARVEDYNIFNLVGDIVGLVHALGEEKAIIIGHDWGSNVAAQCALLRPDMFYKVALLSVPFMPRLGGNTLPTDIMKKVYGEEVFYQILFQEPGKVEEDIAGVGAYRVMRGSLYGNSGNPPPDQRWKFTYKKDEKFTDHLVLPDILPDWLTEEDVDYFAAEYGRSGFSGGLNWYRNIDFNWKTTPFLDGAKLLQPTIYLAGDADPVLTMFKGAVKSMPQNVPGLKQMTIFPGVGHWINQERVAECNDLILDFLKRP
jgi:pimeloyl-ACP methyl ester carboxylesterase